MNKKVKLAVVATVAAIAGVVLYQSQAKGVEMSDIMQANVEALAARGKVEIPYLCMGDRYNCRDTYYKETFAGDSVYP